MIYVDEITDYAPFNVKPAARRWGRLGCHLWSDLSTQELCDFAAEIGVPLQHLQRTRMFDHFDLTPAMRAKALANGAVSKSLKAYLAEKYYPMEARRGQ